MKTCKTCEWFSDITIFGKNKKGLCYFYPPTPQPIPVWSMTRPEVKGNDICSKYEKESEDTK